MEILVQALIAFLLKMADNSLGTVKTIFLSKGKYFTASLFAAASTLFYLVAIVQVANSNSIYSMLAMCLATFIGTLLPSMLIERSERDKLYIFDITSDNFENGKVFADKMRRENFAINTSVVYNSNMEKTLLCKVYCQTKDESSAVMKELSDKNWKFNIYIPKERGNDNELH